MRTRAMVKRHPGRTAFAGALLVSLAALVVYWFGPQYLFIDRRVDEPLPTAFPTGHGSGPVPSPKVRTGGGSGAPASAGPSGPVTLATGELRGLEHDSSGRALLIRLPDGSVFLRLEALSTSNGPDLRVYLSDAPAQDDWYVYDDGKFFDLGALKGNIGSSNYLVPRGVHLADYESAVVWCRRFSVGFAVAPLEPSG